ncbi:hypothetical protein WOLCODRAFT_109013 [Wolfiporia cocos MD-104 SS10]|uniref:Uncharacterized protein n=1 Tax=Wolfiporia cocos (strain MD-104) TaxID=742152 RepID=A0A2H3JD61_WOLCO|nr:hypothetical protein WOLCODRAFT_109013 [Wolfiporia cocos MD-104 SS10]
MLELQLKRTQWEMEKWKAEAYRAADSERSLTDTIVQQDEELKRMRKQLESIISEKRDAVEGTERLRVELANVQAAEMQALQRCEQLTKEHDRTIRKLDEKYRNLAALLETRSAELRAAQTYLTKADSHSEADLLRMFEELNSHIYQLSARLADSTGLEGHVGSRIIQSLMEYSHSEDPLYVQIALQICIVAFSRAVIATWSFQNATANTHFGKIHDHLRVAEHPAVSGRWRALTKTSLRLMTQTEQTRCSIRDSLAAFITEIILISGSTTSPTQLYADIKCQYGDILTTMIDLTLSIHQATGEEITSSSIEPVVHACGDQFDTRCMQDENAGGEPRVSCSCDADEKGIILGTVGLGVARVGKATAVSESLNQSQLAATTLLKPKVVLASVVDDFNSHRRGETNKNG